ncbi:MAG: TldD/PmbA family protein [Proteobacteria bacterium]|nr:TldD/PmbA family protein [Pseudomonadota bacterium]MBU1740532.1 TldD/PmbA family protein [Pseudomonadota bacterium]
MDQAPQLHHHLAEDCVRQRVDNFEFYTQWAETLSATAREGQIEVFKRSRTEGTAVRVIHQGRLGFSYFYGDGPEDGRRAVEAAVASSEHAEADEHLSLVEPTETPRIEGLKDESLAGIEVGRKRELALELERAALDYDPRVKKARSAEYSESVVQVALTNSAGLADGFEQSACWLQLMVMARDGDEQDVGWDFDFSRRFDGLDVELVARRAAKMACDQLGAKGVPTGNYPVLLANHVAAEFVAVLSSSFQLDNVIKGKSRLADKEGTKIFAETVTIHDDGLYPGGLGTAPCDDEGAPSRTKTMVEAGVVRGFMADGYWGRRAGRPSTGNSRRPGLSGPPMVGVSNFYLAPGEETFEELQARVERGPLVTEIMGLHTADPVSGRFSVGASGLWLEQGRVVRPFKGVALAGDLFELFGQVAAVGSDLRFTGRHGGPSLLIEDLTISGD